MDRYLIFQLYGPMASWGDVAVGGERPSRNQPGRSAILGMVAAAFGVRREEEARLARISGGYRMAVLLYEKGKERPAGGTLLRDYHTAQVPGKSGMKGHPQHTRRDELASDKIMTILSRREYRADAYYRVALKESADAPHTLEEVADALAAPRFVLYLGRKSCPPALPLAPRLVEAESVREAFEKVEMPEPGLAGTPHSLYWEKGLESGLGEERAASVRDVAVSRSRWQFGSRTECYATWTKEK